MKKVHFLACMLPAVLTVSSTFVATSAITVVSALHSPAVYAAKQPTVRKEIGKPLQEAQELVKAKKIKEANAKFKEAMAVPNKTDFETAMLNEFGAYLALNSKDYAAAAKAYEATIKNGTAPADQRAQRIKLVSQLYYSLKDYAKASQFGNQYLTEVGADKDVSTIVLQSAYLQGDYNKAISIVSKVIADDQKAGKKPSEESLTMLMSSQYKLKQNAEVEKTLQLLVANYPKAEYWQNIFTYLEAARGGTDRTEFETFRLKHAVGSMAAKDYVQMAEMALAVGVPGDARAVLNEGKAKGFVAQGANKAREDRLISMANSQSATDEKELPAQEKQAANKGDLDVKLGEAYLSYSNYNKAIELIQRGQKKGGIAEPDLAQLHLGIAQLKAGNKAEAVKTFKAVPAASKYNKLASLWAIHAAAK